MQQIPKWETDKYWNSIQQICFWQAGNPFKTGADLSKLDGFRVPSYRWKLWWDDGGDEDGDDQASSSLALSPCSSSSAPFHSQYIAFLFSGDCAICSFFTRKYVLFSQTNTVDFRIRNTNQKETNLQIELFCWVERGSFYFVFLWPRGQVLR